jgi:hypothetical protein
MVSPESTRPSLSCDLCIVDFVSACVCKDVCRNSGEIIKLHEVFSNKGGGGGGGSQNLFCISHARFFSGFQLRAYLHAVCWIFTIQTIDNILNKSGKNLSAVLIAH